MAGQPVTMILLAATLGHSRGHAGHAAQVCQAIVCVRVVPACLGDRVFGRAAASWLRRSRRPSAIVPGASGHRLATIAAAAATVAATAATVAAAAATIAAAAAIVAAAAATIAAAAATIAAAAATLPVQVVRHRYGLLHLTQLVVRDVYPRAFGMLLRAAGTGRLVLHARYVETPASVAWWLHLHAPLEACQVCEDEGGIGGSRIVRLKDLVRGGGRRRSRCGAPAHVSGWMRRSGDGRRLCGRELGEELGMDVVCGVIKRRREPARDAQHSRADRGLSGIDPRDKLPGPGVDFAGPVGSGQQLVPDDVQRG